MIQMDLSTILTTICFISITRKSTVQSADLINPGSHQTLSCDVDCNVLCSISSGCERSLFYINNTVPILVNCTAKYSCGYSVFYFKGSASVDLHCRGDDACYNVLAYVFNPNFNMFCHQHSNGGYESCRSAAVLDLVSPASGRITIAVDGGESHEMSVFSFFHQGQIYYCIHSCDLMEITIYYGLKFNEYCTADDTACQLTQAAISDTVYGAYTIMDSLSGAYGTDFDFRAYEMNTNALLPLVDYKDDYDTFYPPTMANDTFLSILCFWCYDSAFELQTVDNVIMTGMRLYSTLRSTVTGPISSFMVNSYHVYSVFRTTFILSNYDNVYITIGTLTESSVYLGNNVNVEIICSGPILLTNSYGCHLMDVYSDVDPDTTDISTFLVDCSSGCSRTLNVHFPSDVPPTTCYFTSSTQSECTAFHSQWSNCECTADPTNPPTHAPSSVTHAPSSAPTTAPSAPTKYPTKYPTISTMSPTRYPTTDPSIHPTRYPTADPSINPTRNPTADPSIHPTRYPAADPSINPTRNPTIHPTKYPSVPPTPEPTGAEGRVRTVAVTRTTKQAPPDPIFDFRDPFADHNVMVAVISLIAVVVVLILALCVCGICWYKSKKEQHNSDITNVAISNEDIGGASDNPGSGSANRSDGNEVNLAIGNEVPGGASDNPGSGGIDGTDEPLPENSIVGEQKDASESDEAEELYDEAEKLYGDNNNDETSGTRGTQGGTDNGKDTVRMDTQIEMVDANVAAVTQGVQSETQIETLDETIEGR